LLEIPEELFLREIPSFQSRFLRLHILVAVRGEKSPLFLKKIPAFSKKIFPCRFYGGSAGVHMKTLPDFDSRERFTFARQARLFRLPASFGL